MTVTAEQAAAVDLSQHPVWAVTMVRDEADVIEGTLRHMAGEGVTGIIVADNGSTDGTVDILEDLATNVNLDPLDGVVRDSPLGCELIVAYDSEVGYYQSRKMTELAFMAATVHGAEWVVPFDADELWVAPHALARYLAVIGQQGCDVVEARLFHHLATAVDVEDPDPFRAMVWRQPEPAGLPKVAFRWYPDSVIAAGNHNVSRTSGSWSTAFIDREVEVRHFPARSAAQFRRKGLNGAEAYRATEGLPENVGAHWRQYGDLADRFGPEVLEEVFRDHWFYPAPVEAGLIRDPAPYCRWEETG